MNTKSSEKFNFEDALDLTGFGKYNVIMLTSCCFLILAMYLDIFGFSVLMPVVTCDMSLTTTQQGLLSAVPLIGIMVSSYGWGLCADTLGRRRTLLLAMPIGLTMNLASSMAPGYASLTVLKFLSASFTSSANAAGFVLVGETVPRRHRSRFMFLMASATMLVQLIICIIALPVFQLTIRVPVNWVNLEYRTWRLLMQLLVLPGIIGVLILYFMHESPKFFLSIRQEDEVLTTLRSMYNWNTGFEKRDFPVARYPKFWLHYLSGLLYFISERGNAQPCHRQFCLSSGWIVFNEVTPRAQRLKAKRNERVTAVYVDDSQFIFDSNASFLRKMWNQTAPLFKPPLLKNSLILYYILLCAFMTSTGYTMWVPTIVNAYFNGEDKSGQSFCQVVSGAASTGNNNTSTDCDNVIPPLTLYAVMCYSGVSGTLNILLSFIVGPLGKRRTTLLVFATATISGVILLFVRVAVLSILLFYVFLYIALILGNVNTYLVELNPTHLRGMATCLSVVVARGFGFFSVQLIALLLDNNCTFMIGGYVMLVASGLIVSLFLPSDTNKTEEQRNVVQTTSVHNCSENETRF